MQEENQQEPIGRLYGPYRVMVRVGEGGMGSVFRALDETLHREVALKVLHPHLSRDADIRERFLREARAAARLDHPGIVRIYAAGCADNGDAYLAMQLVEGWTLREVLTLRKQLGVEEVQHLLSQLADALHHAHQQGIVHRDLKPENIMVEPRLCQVGEEAEHKTVPSDRGLIGDLRGARVRILDYGLARILGLDDHLTRKGEFLGTPTYSSPEQCSDGPVDARTDLYALGVVAYEALAGRVPHKAETPMALFRKVLEVDAPDPRTFREDLPEPLVMVLEELLARNPETRTSSARVLKSRLAALSGRLEGASPSPSPAPAARRLGWLGLVAALLMVSTALAIFRPWEAPQPLAPFRAPQLGLSAIPRTVETAAADQQLVRAVRAVVYDFENISGRAEDDWIGVAVSSMITAHLGQVEVLKFIPRAAVRDAMKDHAPEMRSDHLNRYREDDRSLFLQVAAELGADVFITGNYWKQGEQLFLSMALHPIDGRLTLKTSLVNGAQSELIPLVDSLSRMFADELAQVLVELPLDADRELELEQDLSELVFRQDGEDDIIAHTRKGGEGITGSRTARPIPPDSGLETPMEPGESLAGNRQGDAEGGSEGEGSSESGGSVPPNAIHWTPTDKERRQALQGFLGRWLGEPEPPGAETTASTELMIVQQMDEETSTANADGAGAVAGPETALRYYAQAQMAQDAGDEAEARAYLELALEAEPYCKLAQELKADLDAPATLSGE